MGLLSGAHVAAASSNYFLRAVTAAVGTSMIPSRDSDLWSR